ncbi:MAG: hypothetical protein JKY95_01810 [Planctomycetaceae bacterium]|nr:hypothetical protein [Planctomycetaceae bacterium]
MLNHIRKRLESAEESQKIKHLRTTFNSWKYEPPPSKAAKVRNFKTGDSGWYFFPSIVEVA